MTDRRHWQQLRQVIAKPLSEALIADAMAKCNLTREAAIAALERETNAVTLWRNHVYQVARRVLSDGKLIHLNIRRVDGKPILRDWRHFQWIKNELVGEECEAVELYPAESRLVDTSNKYHLFCVTDPEFRFPFGFADRDVKYDDGNTPGTRQRKL